MAEPTPAAEATSATPKPAEKASKPPNPVWRLMGLPNMKMKLPSRNWMIFLSITGSFTAAVIYDKREKKRAQKKWAKLVQHVAKEPLGIREMPRKFTVYLECPPGDSLRLSQDHFREYVKPILVASGLDWQFIQGRNEGDIRAKVAEDIRKKRRPAGEQVDDDLIAEARRRAGISEFAGPAGDIVLGRNTWKEYVRGVHEGWLGPLTAPELPPAPESEKVEEKPEEKIETLPGITIISSEGEKKPEEKDETKKDEKPAPTPAYISTLDYPSQILGQIPLELTPTAPITFPHLLGFLNTPVRLYRFLNRRQLADQVGRETAAVILGTFRPFETAVAPSATEDNTPTDATVAEQQILLQHEEKDWPKDVRKRADGEPERTWLDDVVLDPRIAARMRRFDLIPEDEARAKAIVVPEEEIEGNIKGGIRALYRGAKDLLGFGPEKPMTPSEQVEESLK